MASPIDMVALADRLRRELAPQLETIRGSATQYKRWARFFSPWYFGDAAVEKVVKAIREGKRPQSQTRKFTGLVQATMTGTS
jgi:hypothetical protein